MTARAKKMARLVHLREEQHAVTAVALRAAHADLHAVERAIDVERSVARDASLQMRDALLRGDAEGWMLECAGEQVAQMGIVREASRMAAARARVTHAAAYESTARCELKKMERVLEGIQRADAVLAARREQSVLDEAARLLRMRSSNL